MDYQEYKQEFLESLRNDSAINGTDTEGKLQWKTSGNQSLVSGALLRNGNDKQQ